MVVYILIIFGFLLRFQTRPHDCLIAWIKSTQTHTRLG